MSKKLTIAIANYNNGHVLNRCVNSIFESKANFDFEILIIDDASSDNSKDIILELENKYKEVKSFFKDKNKSLGDTRNLAYQLAQGEYVLNFDADDYFVNNFLEELSNIPTPWPDIVTFNFYYDFFKSNENLNYKDLEHFKNRYEFQIVWNKIIKKEIIINNNIKALPINMYEDVSFMINARFLMKSNYHINKTLSFYSYNKDSLVQQKFSSKDTKNVKEQTYQQFKEVIVHVINQSNSDPDILKYAKKIYKRNVDYKYLEIGIPEVGIEYNKRDYVWTPKRQLTFWGLNMLFNNKIVLNVVRVLNRLRNK